ncbi:MAG: host-nuclease inhibitor Gam family protein [Patescibacteria group bacterium]
MKNITTVNAANDAVRSVGEIVNAISTAEAKAAERIAEIKAKANDVTAPLEAELKRLALALQGYGVDNRATLMGDEVRTAKLAQGDIGFRKRPPSVDVSNNDKAVEALKKAGLAGLIRTYEEVNKELILGEVKATPNLLKGVKFVKVEPGGETFFIKPASAEVTVTVIEEKAAIEKNKKK